MKIKSKKGIELTLQTVVIFIIVIIVLVVVISFFSENFTSNADTFTNVGKNAIANASNN